MPFLLKYETKQRNGIINILEQCKKFTTSTAQQNMLQHLDQPHSIDFLSPNLQFCSLEIYSAGNQQKPRYSLSKLFS